MKLLDFIPVQVRWLLAAAALVMAFLGGVKVESIIWKAHEADALKAQQIAFQKQLAKQQTESETYETERAKGQQDNRARQTEVRTIYRDRVVDPGCAVPDDARRLLQDATTGANRAAGQSGE